MMEPYDQFKPKPASTNEFTLDQAPEKHTSGRVYPTYEELQEAARQIATILHEATCRYDHTEGCGWELYETGEHAWDGYAHKRYYDKAVKAMNNVWKSE